MFFLGQSPIGFKIIENNLPILTKNFRKNCYISCENKKMVECESENFYKFFEMNMTYQGYQESFLDFMWTCLVTKDHLSQRMKIFKNYDHSFRLEFFFSFVYCLFRSTLENMSHFNHKFDFIINKT